jgi:hypothetical protein
LAGHAYPHPPQFAASLLTSAEQVPGACVPAGIVPVATGAEGTGVAAGMVVSGTSGLAPDLFIKVQPAVIIRMMTAAHRNT